MDIQTVAMIFQVIFFLIPANNQTTSYIRIIGLIASSSVILLNADWAKVKELLDVFINNIYEWLLIKADGNQEKANSYFVILTILAIQPIILGIFLFYKKEKIY
ncbi:hypothetical protein HEMROJRC1_20550 [Rodentibacter sp. JRC1]|uniref:hypothetical protein n=1 Tax=Rodentibacter sp. JRC1 TaxID=2874504 RepID=UPI001CFC77F7|nr:hypothetical protein [Rodentibacter sp. JRC1]GJI56943.1 hypothetical protein HEMROJRC1_20550 [Rodentibacter sp. JRC1]